MSLKAAVHTALIRALTRDRKKYDPRQVMKNPPYRYTTLQKIRLLLCDVAHELVHDHPPIDLNVDRLDLRACVNEDAIHIEEKMFRLIAKEGMRDPRK